MIDLHCHTTNSDGTWTTEELLKKAEETRIKILSITDHDSVRAYYDINISDYYKGTLITGVEIHCVFNGARIELLGYGFKKENINKYLETLYGNGALINNRIKQFNDMVEICKLNNVKISEKISYDPNTEYPEDIIYLDIIKYSENRKLFTEEVWNSELLFVRKCTTDKEFILYKDYTNDFPQAKDVSNIIRNNGGKVFLAHLFTYELKDHIDFLKEMVKENILDGVECYYSEFDYKQTKLIEDYCNSNNLFKSGGSDCHGDNEFKLGINLGTGYGDLIVKEEAIREWV